VVNAVKIEVTLDGRPVSMSVIEAYKLMRTLQREIKTVLQTTNVLEPPKVFDGYLTKGAALDFFAQVYEGAQLEGRVGRLFGRITLLTKSSEVDFDVICVECGNHVSQHCGGPKRLTRHREVKIGVGSLKRCSAQFLEGTFRNLGPDTRDDFRTLLNYL
jgi:hypothetical protein